jgi:hypothetical protein
MMPFTWLVVVLWAVYCLAFLGASFLMSPGDWVNFLVDEIVPVMLEAAIVAAVAWLGGYLMTWSLRRRA